MFSKSHFTSLPVSMMPLASLILVFMLAVYPAQGLTPRNFLGQSEDEGGKDYLQEPYLDQSYTQMDDGLEFQALPSKLYENSDERDFSRGDGENREKRERCYCDLDLFCKRFGCRRKRGHLAAAQAGRITPVSRKAKLLLELARSLSPQRRRRMSS